MVIRGIRFSNVFNASGARGFYKEGYWYHRWWAPFGLRYKGSTFVAKTTTLNARMGNMGFSSKDLRPLERVPKCIVVKPMAGVVLNSVGLSGPGLMRLLPYWAEIKDESFFISYMSVEKTTNERVAEAHRFVGRLIQNYHQLPTKLGIQVNFSCPNVGLDPSELAGEVTRVLDEFEHLRMPLLAKLNVLFPVEVAAEIAKHSALDGIVMSNTVPWGKLPEKIDWKGLFGSETSPLAHIGGGGLSGKPLLPLVQDWVDRARRAGFRKCIIAGGGVLSARDADLLLDAGADGVELGSVSILRPWRVAGIIRHVNKRTEGP